MSRHRRAGSSAGAAPVLEAVVANPDLAAGVVLLSPAGGDLSAVGDVSVLVLYSEDESSADTIESMVEAATGVDVETVALPGDRHGQGILDSDQEGEVIDAIRELARR